MPKNDDIIQFNATPPYHMFDELAIRTNSLPYRLLDIRPRCERRKFIHLLDNVTAVLFLADISLYDEMLDEDISIASTIQSLPPLPLTNPNPRSVSANTSTSSNPSPPPASSKPAN